ncbi:unnamed protein product, partial [Amoebophrya sp. A120]
DLGATLEKLRKLAPASGPQKPWISEDTWNKIEERRKAKASGAGKVTKLTREINKLVKADRAAWVQNKIETLKQADACGNTKVVFDTVRQLAGRGRKRPQELPGPAKVWTDFWGDIFGKPRPQPPDEVRQTKTWKRCEREIERNEPGPTWCEGLDAVPSRDEV